jgi:hypothetical protein
MPKKEVPKKVPSTTTSKSRSSKKQVTTKAPKVKPTGPEVDVLVSGLDDDDNDDDEVDINRGRDVMSANGRLTRNKGSIGSKRESVANDDTSSEVIASINSSNASGPSTSKTFKSNKRKADLPNNGPSKISSSSNKISLIDEEASEAPVNDVEVDQAENEEEESEEDEDNEEEDDADNDEEEEEEEEEFVNDGRVAMKDVEYMSSNIGGSYATSFKPAPQKLTDYPGSNVGGVGFDRLVHSSTSSPGKLLGNNSNPASNSLGFQKSSASKSSLSPSKEYYTSLSTKTGGIGNVNSASNINSSTSSATRAYNASSTSSSSTSPSKGASYLHQSVKQSSNVTTNNSSLGSRTPYVPYPGNSIRLSSSPSISPSKGIPNASLGQNNSSFGVGSNSSSGVKSANGHSTTTSYSPAVDEQCSAPFQSTSIQCSSDYAISSKSPLRQKVLEWYQVACNAMGSITCDYRTKVGYEKVNGALTSLFNEIVLYRRHVGAGGLPLPAPSNQQEKFADVLLSSSELLSKFKVDFRAYEVAITTQEVNRVQLKLSGTNVLHTESSLKCIMDSLEFRKTSVHFK